MPPHRPRRRPLWIVAIAALLGGALALGDRAGVATSDHRPAAAADGTSQAREEASVDGRALRAAIAARASDRWVSGEGVVAQVLADDQRGSRHQRFLLRLPEGGTVLVAHNIDLAPRIDGLREGDRVQFHGEFEWNERGGVVHWTHHDPRGRREGGWLRHAGRTYR